MKGAVILLMFIIYVLLISVRSDMLNVTPQKEVTLYKTSFCHLNICIIEMYKYVGGLMNGRRVNADTLLVWLRNFIVLANLHYIISRNLMKQ
jgi:hypothetical protein